MPATLTLASAGYGARSAFPYRWIILNAIFIYTPFRGDRPVRRAAETGRGVSGDRRIQALLIAFSFGAFIEARRDSARRSLFPARS